MTTAPHGQPGDGSVNPQTTGRWTCLTTTLYDLITVLQEETPAADDQFVVATVAHLLETGHLTWNQAGRIP